MIKVWKSTNGSVMIIKDQMTLELDAAEVSLLHHELNTPILSILEKPTLKRALLPTEEKTKTCKPDRSKSTRPMHAPWVDKNNIGFVKYHDGLTRSFQLPNPSDEDFQAKYRAKLIEIRKVVWSDGASYGQCGVDAVGNGGTIIKAYREAGFYLHGPQQ